MKTKDWKPVGIEGLEPTADMVARSNTNLFVVAGPGAGKTELLAQRACYLLQTGTTPSPKRILAISFKTNSAQALKDRVELRCGSELARRFDSLNFAQFSKGLVDRFRRGIPASFQPTADYEIANISDRDWQAYMNQFAGSSKPADRVFLAGVGRKEFRTDYIYGSPLAADVIPQDYLAQVAYRCWTYLISKPKSALDFPMIERLAELLVRSNPAILRALLMTYSHVLLDEFQDTTHIQFDLVRTIFRGSNAVLTAVGDHRQRIMGFAMALPNAFRLFERDFNAVRHDLVYNYRSAAELVAIQHRLALALDPSSKEATSRSSLIGMGHCAILDFPTAEDEAKLVAVMIEELFRRSGLKPCDVCILVKQLVVDFGNLLGPELSKLGIRSIYDPNHIELLSQPLVRIVLPFLRLSLTKATPNDWSQAIETLTILTSADESEEEQRALNNALGAYVRRSKKTRLTSEEAIKRLLNDIIQVIGEDAIRRSVPEYTREIDYKTDLKLLVSKLSTCILAADTPLAGYHDFVGADCVQIMTVHKSKGLEFDTVFFVGLEDSSWWSFADDQSSDTSAFFVAFSRAKTRAIFTFSAVRTTSRGRLEQTRNTIDVLYAMLKDMGVPTFAVADDQSLQPVIQRITSIDHLS